jgi:hypothetical protein
LRLILGEQRPQLSATWLILAGVMVVEREHSAAHAHEAAGVSGREFVKRYVRYASAL